MTPTEIALHRIADAVERIADAMQPTSPRLGTCEHPRAERIRAMGSDMGTYCPDCGQHVPGVE